MQRICRWIGVVLLIIGLVLAGEIRQEQIKFESSIPKEEEAKNKKIRVLIKNNDFQGIVHNKIEIFAEHGLILKTEKGEERIKGGTIVALDDTSDVLSEGKVAICSEKENDSIVLAHLHRACGTPSYEGSLEVYAVKEGLVIVNELDIESYLEQVVPSEMPSSYELEALKAQAVCARSYAYRQIQDVAYPEYHAHVDDSTSFQVYANSRKTARTSNAVKETAGETVQYQGKIAATYFFSTSSGVTTSMEAWDMKNEDEYPYLKDIKITDPEGKVYEEDLPWYRWEITMEKNELKEALEEYSGKRIGLLKEIDISQRGKSGIVLRIEVVGTEGELVVEKENKIREALGDSRFVVRRKDGSEVSCTDLLPSAFFTIKEEGYSYIIEGGGHGHGIGMSQNGANEMAKEGKKYADILQFFYPGTNIVSL